VKLFHYNRLFLPMNILNILEGPIKGSNDLSSTELHGIFSVDTYCRLFRLQGKVITHFITWWNNSTSDQKSNAAELRKFTEKLVGHYNLCNVSSIEPIESIHKAIDQGFEGYDYVNMWHHPAYGPKIPCELEKRLISFGGICLKNEVLDNDSRQQVWLRDNQEIDEALLRWVFSTTKSGGFYPYKPNIGITFIEQKNNLLKAFKSTINGIRLFLHNALIKDLDGRVFTEEEEPFAQLQKFLPNNETFSVFKNQTPGDLLPPYEVVPVLSDFSKQRNEVSKRMHDFLKCYVECLAYVWIPSFCYDELPTLKWPEHEKVVNGKPINDILKKEIPVQIDGKLAGKVIVSINDSVDKERVAEHARRNERIYKKLESKKIKRTVFVKGKIINFVTSNNLKCDVKHSTK